MEGGKRLFSDRELWALIIPLMGEMALKLVVGMIDTVMVASVGEAAVSGVSLVDSVIQLLIYIFAAMASGGAVVAGQGGFCRRFLAGLRMRSGFTHRGI